MIIVLGFTGTRQGLSPPQSAALEQIFQQFILDANELEFHHGDCIGADEQAHAIAIKYKARTIGHPPIKTSLRAYTINDQNMPPKTYEERNKDIVNNTSLLIACSLTPYETLRSGTWQTVRYAEHVGKETIIIGPDGNRIYGDG